MSKTKEQIDHEIDRAIKILDSCKKIIDDTNETLRAQLSILKVECEIRGIKAEA